MSDIIGQEAPAAVETAPVAPVAPVETPVETQVNAPLDNSLELNVDEFRRIAPSLRKQQQTTQPQEPSGEVKPVDEERKPEESPLDNPAPGPDVKPDEPPTPIANLKLSDGREVTPELLSELEKGTMMQADYTKKTQALADEKKAFESEREALGKQGEQAKEALNLYQALTRDPIGTLNWLYEQYEQQGITEAKDPDELAIEDEIAKYKAELEAANNKLAENDNKLAEKDLSEAVNIFNQHMDSLAEKYKDQGFDRDKVLQFCMEHQIPNPEVGFKAMIHDESISSTQTNLQKQIDDLKTQLITAKETAVNEYLQGKTTRSLNYTPPIGGGGIGAPPVSVTKPKTFKEARASAMSRQY